MNDTANNDGEGIMFPRSNFIFPSPWTGVIPNSERGHTQWDTLRVVDGIGYLNGSAVFVEANLTPLWTGAYYMTEGHTAVPTKKITDCPNGWVLVWSRFSAGAQNDTWNYTFVHKYHANWGGGFCNILNTTSSGYTPAQKYTYVEGTNTLRGHVSNSSNGAQNQCLRAVLAY